VKKLKKRKKNIKNLVDSGIFEIKIIDGIKVYLKK
jgi:hypothetical protein